MRREIVLALAALLTCEAYNAPSYRLRGDAEPALMNPPPDNTRYYSLVVPAIEVPAITYTSGNQPLAPPEYTNHHIQDQETHCVGYGGGDVPREISSNVKRHNSEHSGDHAHHSEEEESSKAGCHFHAGVEHCAGPDKPAHPCARSDRKYSIPLRIGATFTILITSSIAVLGPIFLKQFTKMSVTSLAFTLIKQFGAGVIVATAFVHLLTHAQLLFGSECIGSLKYEGTATAITMAGVFLAFLTEYLGARLILRRRSKSATSSGVPSIQGGKATRYPLNEPPGQPYMPFEAVAQEDRLSVGVMESGIIFHSILIGVTLVVAGDSGFVSLFIVIIFHQMFEGLALGARIASLHEQTTMVTKLAMAGAFGAITPLGMAIGIGVRNKFNGNDKTTLITLGTLDALSAGILIWVALVEMLAADWLHGDLRDSDFRKTVLALAALACGMALMGLLGKWA